MQEKQSAHRARVTQRDRSSRAAGLRYKQSDRQRNQNVASARSKSQRSGTSTKNVQKQPTTEKVLLGPVAPKTIRVIPLGGLSEVGKNMYAIEYGRELVVFECGIMFGEYMTLGVGSMMPNIEFLKQRRKDIRALVISDAAMSHIGALSFALKDMGHPPIYVRPLTRRVIEKEMEAHGGVQKIKFHEIKEQTTVSISDTIKLTFFAISNETPNTFAVLIETPDGCVAYTGSIRLEHKDGVVYEHEKEKYAFLKDKKIVATLSESVNAEKNGFALNDKEIAKEALNMVENADSRVILPLFASQVKRNALIVDGLLRAGKHVYVHGQKMIDNLHAAHEMGLLSFSADSLLSIEHLHNDEPPKKIAILLATEENETYNILSQVSFDQHRYLSIKPDDTVLFPNPMIHSRASALQDLKNRLSRFGAIIGAYSTNDIKALGHAAKEELLWLHQHIQSTFVIPIQGYHYMLVAHAHIAHESGVDRANCITLENGFVADINTETNRFKVLKNKIPRQPLSVDGRTPSVIYDVVLQDRKYISQDGIFIVIILMDQKRLVLKKTPDIISRGFIYLKESKDLMMRARLIIKKVAEKEAQENGSIQLDTLKKAIQKALQNLLLTETSKKPIIVPVIFT